MELLDQSFTFKAYCCRAPIMCGLECADIHKKRQLTIPRREKMDAWQMWESHAVALYTLATSKQHFHEEVMVSRSH